MQPTWIFSLLLAAGLGVPLAWLWAERQRVLRRAVEQELITDEQRRELEALRKTRLEQEQEAARLRRGIDDAHAHERRAARLEEDHRVLAARCERQEAQLRTLGEQLQLVTRSAARHEARSQTLDAEVAQLSGAAELHARRWQRASVVLSLLGWPRWEEAAPPRDLLHPEERALSQAILDRLQARPALEDVVLADRSGAALLGSGAPQAVDRLAAFGALAGPLWQVLGHLMRQEPVLLSLSSVARGLHLTPVGARWLVAQGDPAPPTHELFYARMSLAGAVGEADPVPSAALSLSRGEAVPLRRRLQVWVATHGGIEAALYQTSGEVLAATGAGAPRLGRLLEVWSAWVLRLGWMGWTPETLVLRVQGFRQGHLTLRLLSADCGAAMLLLWGPVSPPDEAVDEFIQQLRWDHLRAASSSPRTAEASFHG